MIGGNLQIIHSHDKRNCDSLIVGEGTFDISSISGDNPSQGAIEKILDHQFSVPILVTTNESKERRTTSYDRLSTNA